MDASHRARINLQNLLLNCPHGRVGPQARVPVEVRGKPFVTRKVKQNAIRPRLKLYSPSSTSKYWSADGHMLIERGCQNRVRIGANGKADLFLLLPVIHGFSENQSPGEACMAQLPPTPSCESVASTGRGKPRLIHP